MMFLVGSLVDWWTISTRYSYLKGTGLASEGVRIAAGGRAALPCPAGQVSQAENGTEPCNQHCKIKEQQQGAQRAPGQNHHTDTLTSWFSSFFFILKVIE